MAATSDLGTLQLHFENRDGKIIVTPENEDRFLMTVETAIRACRIYQEQMGLFRLQFNEMLRRLAAWLDNRRDAIAGAYLTVRDADLLFLVVRGSAQYDAQFEDELTELDIGMAQAPESNLIRLSVLAIPEAPEESLASFLAPGKTFTYRHAQ